MIRPQIVPYTEDWRPGVVAMAKEVGWTEEMAEWTWNPLTTFLAIHRGRVVGFIAGMAGDQPVGVIDTLVVVPELRCHGIGVFLWMAMVRRLFALGVKRIRVLTGNESLQQQFERYGFTTIQRGVVMEVNV